MKYIIQLLIVCFFFISKAYSQHLNDECSSARVITTVSNYCSADGQFNNIRATPSNLNQPSNWTAVGSDIWLKFTAVAYDVNVTVSGAVVGGGSTGGTLQAPLIALYSTNDCQNYETVIGSMNRSGNATTYYKGGLVIGRQYYIRISAENNNTGTFKLCVNNYNPILKAGQDCSSASVLCNKESFTEQNVAGAGMSNREADGSCLTTEANSAWYKWTAANNGTLTFIITPTVSNDDIDWVLYDLGTSGNCGGSVMRCAAGHGVDNSDCPREPLYYKTGLNLTETDFTERGGCGSGQNGFVRYIDMQQGHVYALLVDNYSNANNGFSIDFGGTGEFVGPEANFQMVVDKPCTEEQSYRFTNLSTNYSSLKWSFGDGANVQTSTAPGPHTITYLTPGIKTVVLEAIGDKGCIIVYSQSFAVGLKPELPIINPVATRYCLGESITLSTPFQPDATYSWQGPNGFTSSSQEVIVPVTSYDVSGIYTLRITVFDCTSDAASRTIPLISQTPVPKFSIIRNAPCSPEQTFTFINESEDFTNLTWNFGEGADTESSTEDQRFTITYDSPGTKTISLLLLGESGCEVSLSQTLQVPQIPEIPEIVVSKPVFCLRDSIFLSASVQSGAVYQWRGPNNFRSSQREVSIPVLDFTVSGEYILVVSMGICSTEPVSVLIPEIQPDPVAAFISTPELPAKLALPVTVRFQNQSRNADSYLWDFGDGTTSTELSPEHSYTSAGDYEVTLTAFRSTACKNSVTRGRFVIRTTHTVFVPNTFTPNGDGVNDELVVTITNLVSYHLRIFNRWGTPLFQTYNIFDNWSGAFRGDPLPVGVYYYVIDGFGLDGAPVKESGSVTIIR